MDKGQALFELVELLQDSDTHTDTYKDECIRNALEWVKNNYKEHPRVACRLLEDVGFDIAGRNSHQLSSKYMFQHGELIQF